jgi:hypothetical protein
LTAPIVVRPFLSISSCASLRAFAVSSAIILPSFAFSDLWRWAAYNKQLNIEKQVSSWYKIRLSPRRFLPVFFLVFSDMPLYVRRHQTQNQTRTHPHSMVNPPTPTLLRPTLFSSSPDQAKESNWLVEQLFV